jgi:LysM repeat protein
MNAIHLFFGLLNTGPAPTVPTITYTVGDRDTLTSVAARFDTTPSELTALNRLGSSFIYSGQTLLVPDKSKIKDDDTSSETSGDTDVSKDKSRKSSSNNDDIPQEEKGKSDVLFFSAFSQENKLLGLALSSVTPSLLHSVTPSLCRRCNSRTENDRKLKTSPDDSFFAVDVQHLFFISKKVN